MLMRQHFEHCVRSDVLDRLTSHVLVISAYPFHDRSESMNSPFKTAVTT
jgi:hypothetical protein